MSNETFWPSLSVRMPDASRAEAWTKTSLPPPSGEMKPKPLEELKNFTVPMVIVFPLDHQITPMRDAWADVRNDIRV